MSDKIFGQAVKLIAKAPAEEFELGTFIVPQDWIDNLAFGGAGFEVVLWNERTMQIAKDCQFVIRFGDKKEERETAEPPFDPPYGSREDVE